MGLGENIRWVRLLAGKKQSEFAEMIGAKSTTVYTYETNKARPNELILSKIAAIAGISIRELETTDSVIMGVTTSVTTKEHFECRYYESF